MAGTHSGRVSMTVRGRARTLLVLLVLAVALTAPAARVAGAEYTMVTAASYAVDPAAGKIAITVEIDFKNTFAAPAGQVSVFKEIRLAIHDHAAVVAAHDATGALNAAVAVSSGVNVVTITLRSGVEYNQTAHLTLTYELHTGDDPAIRIGTHLVTFPAWGFGTASTVAVTLPSDFEVRVDGDALAATTEGDVTTLASGAIANPIAWLAKIGATRRPTFDTIQQAVPLQGGTADVQVRHWTDDPEWGQATMDLLVQALPLLEEAFGLPYPASGPLVVTESVSGGGLGQEPADGELAIGFDEPAFTVLHQAAHVWANDGLATDRWINEGLASWAAAQAAADLEVALPYDPAKVATDGAANAFPLADWSAKDQPPAAESWAYAEAWAVTNQVDVLIGADNLRLALRRIAAGLDGYDLVTTVPDPTSTPAPVDSRAYLDQLDAVSDAGVVEAIAPAVLGGLMAVGELADRTEARTAHDALLERAGSWGDPGPVREAMVEWRFDDALTEMAAATEWLDSRDVLLSEIEAAGLTPPDRLMTVYLTDGGGAAAKAEVVAEGAVVAAYNDVAAAVDEGLGPVAQVGLMIGPSPEERLATAAGDFAAGDLGAAAAELASLRQDISTATAAGLVRILALLAAAGAGVVLVSIFLRRRRPGTDYTPEP